MTENQIREELCRLAKSIYDRGLTFGSSGNISARVEDGLLMTPTGSTMGTLDPARLSKLAPDGTHLSGDKPTKEVFLHTAMYDERPRAGAVVHLHSSYSVAVSCMDGLNETDVMPPLTAYYVMRVGKLPLIPYFAPGDMALADAVRAKAADHHAILMANHGPVVAGRTLAEAVYATEELEETAKIFLTLRGLPTRPLTPDQVAELERRYPVQT